MWRPSSYLDYTGLDGGEGVERVAEEDLPLRKGLGFAYSLNDWT